MKRTPTWIIAVTLALLANTVAADAPNLLNYQGRLTDPSGTPKNGTFTMQFAVYDAESGGNQLPSGTPWSETQSVTVTDGVFNVLLGSVTALPANLFEGGPSDASGPLRFLQVTVDGEALTPRRRIASAAYAVRSSSGGFNSCVLRSGTPGNEKEVSCAVGEELVAGGCFCNGAARESYPSAINTWHCHGDPSFIVCTPWAKCCQ
ncbi:MAG: hypothetical protein HY699_08250 [Deltaproteobacteria bacterium]|nr:hypothetical protein [Deltaproteobacteria bacterium]